MHMLAHCEFYNLKKSDVISKRKKKDYVSIQAFQLYLMFFPVFI